MKTTKKGFTLIELIVVIAIIGVLAAILVPTMLGYVRKSKISSVNSAASSVYKAINSALTELDEEGIDVGGDYVLTYTNTSSSANTWATGSGSGASAADTLADVKNSTFKKKVSNFFSDITKEKSVKAAITGGSCVAVACCSDSTYTGTYPGGITTTDSYKTTKPASGPAVSTTVLQYAIDVAGGMKATISDTGAITTSGTSKYADVFSAGAVATSSTPSTPAAPQG